MAIDLSTLDAREALTAIYIGYYDRAADPAGLAFWEDVVGQDGFNLVSITTLFAAASETNDLFPFFADPASTTPTAFLTQLYLNLFNREPDPAGLAYWANELSAAVNGERADDDPNPGNPVLTVGQIITSIIEGAQAPDDEVITNKIAAALDWTATAETVSDFEYNDAAAQSAAAVIDGVDETQASVAAAAATTDSFFEPLLNPSVPGDEIDLEIGVTRVSGTENDDQFNAFVGQNASGGIANTLSSASNLDGKGGNDRLHAELAPEFLGTSGAGGSQNATDIQPRLKNIEEIDFEARDGANDDNNIVVDAKNIIDHVEIGSYFSDGDLKIENLTTLRSDDSARNTDAITVTMDHTDNFNSDNDASDLTVLFDNDYLLAGEASEFTIQLRIVNTLELARNDDPLNSFKSITFTVGETEVMVDIEGLATYAEVRDAINAELDAQGITGVIADVDLARTAIFTDDIEEFDQGDLAGSYLPVNIVSTNQPLATGPIELISDIEDFNGLNTWVDGGQIDTQDPISVSIDLHKAGRGGEGGDIIIGGKADNVNEGIAGGIEVFNIDVLGIGGDGAAAKPSNVGTITSTLDSLRVVNINTAAEFKSGDSFASLVVRNGFNGNLDEIDADGFLGNLTLGDGDPVDNGFNFTDDGVINNVETISAMGGGNITINAVINEAKTAFDYDTGAGNDEVNISLNGDALDYAGSELDVSTGAGNDEIDINFVLAADTATTTGSSEQLNQAILDNVQVDGGSGDDMINVDGLGNANIMGGSGNDVIMTDGDAAALFIPGETVDDPGVTIPANNAVWAFNFDADRALAATGGISDFAEDELPGEQLSLAYIGGATVTVTLSGAGISGNTAAGGGVMSDGGAGAVIGDDGYESEVVISDLLNGNDHYGTQADINLAVIEAINEDDVLGQLLTASMGPNNTLVVKSMTSGAFDATDLRIDITQLDQGDDADDWDDVEDEAQSIFRDSDITITDLATANTGPGASLATSADADSWYDGLSVDDLDDETTAAAAGTNSTSAVVAGDEASNLYLQGTASASETDNVIDGGAGNDLIVLSTDATGFVAVPFTVSSNNALINGASNETVKMTGVFGDDTVMNFQDGDYEPGELDEADEVTEDTEVFTVTFAADDVTTTVDDELTFDGVTATLPAGTPTSAIDAAAAFFTAYDAALTTTYTAANNGDGTITFTANAPGDVDDVTLADFTGTATANVGSVTVDTQGVTGVPAVVTAAPVNAGLDFLDFTSYLTSEENTSTASGSASDDLIVVTLDVTDTADVQANEVTVTTFDNTDDVGETFAALSASVVEQLFNNGASYTGFAGDSTYGSLDAANFNADDEYTQTATTDELIGGAAKSILMIENADNDGEYKVFELTWNGDGSNDTDSTNDGVVSAVALGSIDFGDTLTDLDAVNVVGTADYEALLDTGFYA